MALLAGAGAVLVAALVQGLTSFGFALVAVPVLLLVYPVREVVPLVVLLSLATNLAVLSRCWRQAQPVTLVLLLVAALAGVPVGTWALAALDARWLKLGTGVLLVAVAGAMAAGVRPRREGPPGRGATLAVGLASGFLNGSVSISGPPIALFFSRPDVDPGVFRANLAVFGLVLNLVTLGVFGALGLLTASVWTDGLGMVPALALGTVAGMALAPRIPPILFRRLTLGLVAVGGLATVWTALRAF